MLLAVVVLAGLAGRLRWFVCALALTGLCGLAANAAPALADGGVWGPPQVIDPAQQAAVGATPNSAPAPAVWCGSADFCMVIEPGEPASGVGSSYITFDGWTWSTPQSVSPSSAFDPGTSFTTSVSCTDEQFCVAVNNVGQAVTYNGSNWSAPTLIDPSTTPGSTGNRLTSVACSGTSFCIAVDDLGYWFADVAGSWTDEGLLTGAEGPIGAVSCADANYCMATADGDSPANSAAVYTFNGLTWSSGVEVDTNPLEQPAAVSCGINPVDIGPQFCGLADETSGGGDVSTFNGSSWSPATNISGDGFGSISCSGLPDYCVAIDGSGDAASFNGTSWSAPQPLDSGTSQSLQTNLSLSCGEDTFCVAADGAGDAAIYEAPLVNTFAPFVTGGTAQGDTLTLVAGGWDGSPISQSYEWEDCDSSGNSCMPIAGATGMTYVLTAADVDHTIGVLVTVSNAAGTSASAFSRLSAVVTGAGLPTPTTTTPTTAITTPTTTTSTPPPATTPVAVARVTPKVPKIAAPSGKKATIAAILKRAGDTVSLTSATSGKLRIDWYYATKVEKKSKVKVEKTLIANAKATVTAAHKKSLKVKLTSKGSSLLKQSKKLKVTDETSFTPIGGKAISRTTTFTLKG